MNIAMQYILYHNEVEIINAVDRTSFDCWLTWKIFFFVTVKIVPQDVVQNVVQIFNAVVDRTSFGCWLT